MDQVFEVSTAFGAASLTAAIEAGQFGPHRGRRVLVTSLNVPIPEVATPPELWPTFPRLAMHMDDVASWNDLIAPLHPHEWSPRPHDLLVLGHLLRDRWRLRSDSLEVVLESIQVPPAEALSRLFDTAAVSIYSDGLMSYGPTRSEVKPHVLRRIKRLLFLDLVPGVEPFLLSETTREPTNIDRSAFRGVVRDLPLGPTLTELVHERAEGPTALLLGQYLTSLGFMSVNEEAALYLELMTRLARGGYSRIVFKPHPQAPQELTQHVVNAATASDVSVRLWQGGLAESAFEHLKPDLVAGCFSTGLATARSIYEIPVGRFGTGGVLGRLDNPQNSNRIPLVIVDATVPELAPDGTVPAPPLDSADSELALRAVAYEMQPNHVPHFSDAARRYRALQESGVYPAYLAADARDRAPVPERAPVPGSITSAKHRLRRFRSRNWGPRP